MTKLTPRESDTLRLLLTGASEKQIAKKLHIAPATVHSFVKAIFRVYGVRSRPQLMARFIPARLKRPATSPRAAPSPQRRKAPRRRPAAKARTS